eukprot:TRINITY_DN4212_c0_g1_i1.p1 TRINITY_DN4212_c0_g1~~TRINITY_DN4212_c0_g1_i1.p1  ORF type:complete len:164 (-),score=28.75 TRINITY_DN4212_c0_g1_i1:31-522(-)
MCIRDRYIRDDELPPGANSMENIKVSEFFESGSKHRHVYDFSNRTVLNITKLADGMQPKMPRLTSSVASSATASESPSSALSSGKIEKESKALTSNVFIVARNQPHKFSTATKGVASHYCQECQSYLSSTEIEEDDDGCCGKECLSRICNSPRWGVCGYGEQQ